MKAGAAEKNYTQHMSANQWFIRLSQNWNLIFFFSQMAYLFENKKDKLKIVL